MIESIVRHPTDIVSIHHLWILGEERVTHLIGGRSVSIRVTRAPRVDPEERCPLDFTVCDGALARRHVVDRAVEVNGFAGLEGARWGCTCTGALRV